MRRKLLITHFDALFNETSPVSLTDRHPGALKEDISVQDPSVQDVRKHRRLPYEVLQALLVGLSSLDGAGHGLTVSVGFLI